jgi:cytochrome c5
MTNNKPFYQTKLFLNSFLVILFTTIVVYSVLKIEKDVQEENAHENDGYVQMSTVKTIGSRDSLKMQSYVVNIHKDQRIQTDQGAIIRIPANALQSKDSTVELLVKEAYIMEDMIRAGLTTKTGKELLSSGGMFYIQPKDSANVKIIKPISIEVPTEEVNANMKLFKGQRTPLGKIDWQDPVALKMDTTKVISEGETLFKANCKSCHTLGQESVGPDLAYIGKRRDFDWIKRFTQNAASMIVKNNILGMVAYTIDGDTTVTTEEYINGNDDTDQYASCLLDKYNKSLMPSFIALKESDIKEICKYINVESTLQKLPYPDDKLYICVKKCKEYKTTMNKLHARKYELQNKRSNRIIDNGSFVKDVSTSMGVLGLPSSASAITGEERKSLIHANYQQSEYYQVEINAFGWYNIDMLTKNLPGLIASNLIVQVKESFMNTFQLYFVLPDMKIHVAGGLLKDKKDAYGFYEDNGNIKLPQGKTAHIYLVGEKNGKLLYAAATFMTDTVNRLSLNPTFISKEAFNHSIKELFQDEGITIKVMESKNASAIRKIDTDLNALDEQIKEAEKLKPIDCDCNCGVEETSYSESIIQIQSVQSRTPNSQIYDGF